RRNSVLRRFGEIKLGRGLGLNLDRFAGLWITPHARLAMYLLQAAQAGNNKYTVLLRLFHRCVGQVLQKRRRGLVVDAHLFRQMTDKLGLGQSCCHESSLDSKVNFPAGSESYLNTRACGKTVK